MGFIIAVSAILLVVFAANYFIARSMRTRAGDEVDASNLPRYISDNLSRGKAFLYFYTEHCPNCKNQERIFNSMNKLNFNLIEINASTDRKTTEYFGIKGTPAFVIVSNGIIEEVLLGVQNKKTLTDKIES